MVDQAGDKYVECTVTLSATANEDYTNMGSESYYLKISNTNTRVRLAASLSGTSDGYYVGEGSDQVAQFSFDNKEGFDTKSTTFYLAVSPQYDNTAWDNTKVDSAPLTIAATDWDFSANKTGVATLVAFAK